MIVDKWQKVIHSGYMIDIALIRQKPDWVASQLAKRGFKVDFAKFVKIDEKKRKAQADFEDLRAQKNKLAKDIMSAINKGEIVAASKKLGEEIARIEKTLNELETETFEFMSALPNIPLPDVQAGDKEANKVVKTFLKQPKFAFTPKDHVELCTSLGLIDYERAAKMSGARTWVYTGMGARLEWALLNYFIDFHIANGYTFIMPPHLLNYESGYAAGQFPKFADDVFQVGGGKFLLPTAETALINMHRDEIIPVEKLPIKYAGYSPCYRTEAGNYRKDERGMLRGHQFNKVEMFIFCKPEDSAKFFEELVRNAEKLVEGLGLHYQTVALAAGDVSASMAKTYDIEVFIPSFGYKEVSSCSNAMDYQARRAKIRTKLAKPSEATGSSVTLVHTLNASGLATSRLVPAIVEQFQTKDGRVIVPDALRKYLGVELL